MEGIIVGVDESPYARAALRWAADHGARHDRPVTALLAWGYIDQHHAEPGAPFDPDYSAAVAAKVLDDLVDRTTADHDAVRRVVVNDLPGRALLEAGDGADLVVVGARGIGGFRGLLLGSVSRQVLHHATCPVAVIRDAATRADQPVVVGLDGSEPSRRALRWAFEEARSAGRCLVAVHAWLLPYSMLGLYDPAFDPPALAAESDRFLRRELAPVDTSGLIAPVEIVSSCDRPAAALLEAAALGSVLVVGSRGRGELASAVFGSVSDQVSHHATCPVVVVP